MSSSRRYPLIGALLALGACADGDEVGEARFALTADAAFFRLRIYAQVPAALGDDALFDTGCLQQQSRTYELSNIPVGAGYTVVYEGFSDFGCDADKSVALGYRGGVAVQKSGELPYFHVQVYPKGDIATLPEDINLSASVARVVDFCEDAAACGANEVCYDAAKPEYWCVPTCASDADCRAIHVRASCDVDAGWCTLRSPFPLNLSEPRAFGAAGTLSDGDVIFIGGYRQDGVGGLLPTMHPLERFDAQTGLFTAAAVTGDPPPIGGDTGFTQLAADRFVTVGGFKRAKMIWGDAGLELETESADVSADVIVWDFAGGSATSFTLARSVARPGVVRLAADRFFVAGGLVVSGPGLEATRSTSLCTIAGGAPSCEPGPTLEHPRQAPAMTCLDEACSRVLVLGGNPGGQLAEIVDLEEGSGFALDTSGFGDKVFAPVLCGMNLVGGSTELARAAPFQAMSLTVKGGDITLAPLADAPQVTYLAASSDRDTSFGATPECWLGGGIEGNNSVQSASARVARAAGTSLEARSAVLGRGRFGAVAARIGGGLLAGRILFAGGVSLDGEGPVKVVRGAEVMTP